MSRFGPSSVASGARIVEIAWPTTDDAAAVDTALLRLEPNPRWPADCTRLRGAVAVNVPTTISAGTATILLRHLRSSDLPRYGVDAFLGRADLIDLPMTADEAGFRFRIRYSDQRAALASAGRQCLLHLLPSGREGGRP